MNLIYYTLGLLLPISAVQSAASSLDEFSSSITRRSFQPGSFFLTNIFTTSFPETSSVNREIVFDWSDPASNSSVYCSKSWLDTNMTSTRPTSYILCATPSTTEFWNWYFNDFKSLGAFSLQLEHIYKDDYFFPPPYDYPAFFANVSISLHCVGRLPYQVCFLPAGTRQIEAPINGMAD